MSDEDPKSGLTGKPPDADTPLMERFAKAIRDGAREPDPFLCRHLRTNTWYVPDSYTERNISRSSSTAPYWCLKTMRRDGPDGALALPENCTDERACFEPASSPTRSVS